MSSFRENPSEFDVTSAEQTPTPNDVTAAIGTDERRMHVRAYNYWVSLLDGRDFPSIEDLEPADVDDFASHSVLLDFTCGGENPALPYIGAAIREECALDDGVRAIADVPSRSLLSRLTDHYMQIIANRAPVGFEAEFENPRDESICYRGILMPFSSDGDTIDFIYGVINWKHVGADAVSETLPETPAQPAVEIAGIEEGVAAEAFEELPFELNDAVAETDGEPLELTDAAAERAGEPPEPIETVSSSDDEPFELTDAVEATAEEPTSVELAIQITQIVDEQTESAFDLPPAEGPPPVHFAWEDGPLADENDVPIVQLDENAGLADRLWAARETAESAKAGEGRTRAALYRALSLAYDFAIAAKQNPDDYAELLEESGVKAQARAPMTPIVKLVFGIDYDKARLTEFAAALSYGERQGISLGAFQDFIEKQAGGLKALVAAERQARRPEPKPDTKIEAARARLRDAPSISLADIPTEDEFALVVTRRGADGSHEPVAVIDDQMLVKRAIRRAA